MIEIKYHSGIYKKYKNLGEFKKNEKLFISNESLSSALKNGNYYGKAAEILFMSNISFIRWINRFGEKYEYDVMKTVPEEYWDIIDFSK